MVTTINLSDDQSRIMSKALKDFIKGRNPQDEKDIALDIYALITQSQLF